MTVAGKPEPPDTEPSNPSSATEPKILRISVTKDHRLLETHLIRNRTSVTIGPSSRNTILMPDTIIPQDLTLFALKEDKYKLQFNKEIEGRVTLMDEVLSLEEVREKGVTTTDGELIALPLEEDTRGLLTLGDFNLLFQFVSQPATQPRPQLPPSIRGGFVNVIDWVLLTSFIVLAVIHALFLFYLHSLDYPRDLAPDMIPDRFAEYIPELPEPEALDASKLEKVGEEAKKKETPKKANSQHAGGALKPCDKACQEAKAAARRAYLAKRVSKMGILKLLGTKGTGTGTATNLIADGDPSMEADKAFAKVGGLRTSSTGSMGLGGRGGSRSGAVAGIGDLSGRVAGPTTVGTGKMIQERTPVPIVKRSAPEIEGNIDSNAVSRTIRRAMGSVTTCYKRALRRNPELAGKIAIRITINSMGMVTSIEIDEDTLGDPQVISCITGLAKRWRFPPPKGGTSTVSVPFVFRSAKRGDD